MAEDRIVVAGGGLGGLGVALGLAQNGKRAVVLEKAPELGEIGAGIQLGPECLPCVRLSRRGQGCARTGGLRRTASFHGCDDIRGDQSHPAGRGVS